MGHILKFPRKKEPEDAFYVGRVTMIDLYPRDSWCFVFIQASLTDGVGIFSFARYGSDFYSSSYEGKVKAFQKTSSSDYSVFDDYHIPAVTSVLLLRSCKCLPDWGRECDRITCCCARKDQDGLTVVNISFVFVLGNRLKTSDGTNRFC